MPVLASDIMDGAAALLNDAGKSLFSYAAQLPYLRKANEDLGLILVALGQAPIQRATSNPIDVPASASIITLGSLPSDLFVPLHVWERADDGAIGEWQLMDEKEWEPDLPAGTTLCYWTFRNNNIYFPPCSTDREVKVDYWRFLTSITSSSSNEEVIAAKTYLEAKTAALCARYIGENPERADALEQLEVIPIRERLEGIYVKNSQSLRGRRKRFGRSRITYSR